MFEQLDQPLDGLKLEYAYEGGGQIIASFCQATPVSMAESTF